MDKATVWSLLLILGLLVTKPSIYIIMSGGERVRERETRLEDSVGREKRKRAKQEKHYEETDGRCSEGGLLFRGRAVFFWYCK